MTSREWSENYDNVLKYASFLASTKFLYDPDGAKGLLYFFEKPWKVNNEDFEDYIEWGIDQDIEITDKERNEFYGD